MIKFFSMAQKKGEIGGHSQSSFLMKISSKETSFISLLSLKPDSEVINKGERDSEARGPHNPQSE